MKELIKKCLLNDEEMKKIIVDNFVKDGMADANEYDWGVNDEECEIARAQLEKALPIILSDIKKELEGLQNPYAFMDGNPIPKWISEFRAYGECYKDVIERLRDIYP